MMSNIPISEPHASFPGSRKKNIQQTQSNWRVQNLWKTLIICGDSPKLIIGSLHLDVCLDVQRETAGTIETTKQNKKKTIITIIATHLYISIHFPCPLKNNTVQKFQCIYRYVFHSAIICEPSWWAQPLGWKKTTTPSRGDFRAAK